MCVYKLQECHIRNIAFTYLKYTFTFHMHMFAKRTPPSTHNIRYTN